MREFLEFLMWDHWIGQNIYRLQPIYISVYDVFNLNILVNQMIATV